MWDCFIGLIILPAFLLLLLLVLFYYVLYKGKELNMLYNIQNEVFQEVHSDVRVLFLGGKLPVGLLVFSLSTVVKLNDPQWSWDFFL